MIVSVNQGADADVQGFLQNLRHGDHAGAAAAPVGIAHFSTIHLLDAAADVHHVRHFDVSVVHGDEEGHGFEDRPRLVEVLHRVGIDFLIGAVAHACQTRHGFDVACGDFHEDADAGVGTDFHEFLVECVFAEVLHAHVNGGEDVAAVFRRLVNDLEESVQHFLSVGDTRFSAQDGVETQFQSCSSRVFAFVEVSDGSDGESAVRVLSGGELLHVEASRSRTLAEDGELLHHAILDVGDAFVVEFPVVAFCFSSGAHEFSEFHGVDVREDFVHAVADAVHLDFKH